MRRKIIIIILATAFIFSIYIFFNDPTNQRQWKVGFDILPEIQIDSTKIVINNVRNFKYLSDDSFIVDYYNKSYDLNKLESLWFVLSPFADQWRGPAHSFLSFGFSD